MSVSTIDHLEAFEAQDADKPAPLFNKEFGPMLISLTLDLPQFVDVTAFKPEYFETGPAQLVIAYICNYFEKYSTVPTREVLTELLSETVTVDDPHEEIFGLVNRKTDPRNVPYVKEKYKTWLTQQAWSKLYLDDAVQALQQGNYDHLRNIVHQAENISSESEGEPFDFIDWVDFMAEEIKLEWLIDGLVIADQPCIIGGKDKCLKTGIVCDLAISLAAGVPFLNHFQVSQPRRVAFFSAESGSLDIKRRFQAISASKGVVPSKEMLRISFARPHLSADADLAKLQETIKKYKSEVVIVDPLYLTLLAGDDTGTSASDLYGMGNKLGALCDIVAKAGATVVLVHHYKKTTEEGLLGLNEFTFTGAGAFARQSMHIGRRRPYSGPQTNEMRFMNHGFANGCTYALDINEETWETKIEPETEAVVKAVTSKLVREVKNLAHFLEVQGTASKTAIRDNFQWNFNKIDRIVRSSGGQIEISEETGKRLYRLAGAEVANTPDDQTEA